MRGFPLDLTSNYPANWGARRSRHPGFTRAVLPEVFRLFRLQGATRSAFPVGRYVRLVPPMGGDPTGVRQRFRLQSQESQDDTKDAPIDLPSCELLQTTNSAVMRFYRVRLKLDAQDRVTILKDTLRQIGGQPQASPAMLSYLVRYYEDTLARLDHSGEAVHQTDAAELRSLFVSARTVPSLNGTWEVASDCVEAWGMMRLVVSRRRQCPSILTIGALKVHHHYRGAVPASAGLRSLFYLEPDCARPRSRLWNRCLECSIVRRNLFSIA